MRRPLILISNDDGISAPGLATLIQAVRDLGEVWVFAPDKGQSGTSCAISLTVPVTCRKVHEEDGLTMFSCSGTPVDCVKLGIHKLLPRTPDLILGGINKGDNSAVCLHYSGTVGVALEGAMKRIPSVAFSLCCDGLPSEDYSPTVPHIRRIVTDILQQGLPDWTCLNVNFPVVGTFRGTRICRQAYGLWVNEWMPCGSAQTDDTESYQMAGDYVRLDEDHEGTDMWALKNGYIAITPLHIDITASSLITELRHRGMGD